MSNEPVRFHAFGAQHLEALAVLAALALLVAWAGRHWQRSRLAVLGKALGVALVGYGIVVYVQKGLAHTFDPAYDLPVELCHWTLIACVVSLFRPNRLTSEVAYFWGLAGSFQAVLTPDIYGAVPSWDLVLFFWSHGGVLLAILFMIVGQRFQPERNSIFRVFVATNIYGAVAGSVDAAFGWNYGYLLRKPSNPSLMDYLGPWPWYILSLEGVALVYYGLLYVPWWWYRRRSPAGREGRASPADC